MNRKEKLTAMETVFCYTFEFLNFWPDQYWPSLVEMEAVLKYAYTCIYQVCKLKIT